MPNTIHRYKHGEEESLVEFVSLTAQSLDSVLAELPALADELVHGYDSEIRVAFTERHDNGTA